MVKKAIKKAIKKEKKEVKSSTPLGVKIISVFYYLGAALMIILGVTFLFGGGILAANLGLSGGIFTGLAVVAAILTIAFAVLFFFIAKDLWRTKNWARIAVIVLSVIGLLSSISNIGKTPGSSIFNLLLNALIGGYLLFNRNVKKAFS